MSIKSYASSFFLVKAVKPNNTHRHFVQVCYNHIIVDDVIGSGPKGFYHHIYDPYIGPEPLCFTPILGRAFG